MHGVYAITPTGWAQHDLLQACEQVLAAGVCALQYRDKPVPDRRLALALQALCIDFETPLIINDAVELARQLGCGVHVGRNDAGVARARQRLGGSVVVGASAYDDLARAAAAAAAGASYVAFGSVFSSTTKPAAGACPLDVVTTARKTVGLPIVAIGGIHAGNAAQVCAAGADCIAVVGGIFGQDDPGDAVRSLRAAFDVHASGQPNPAS